MFGRGGKGYPDDKGYPGDIHGRDIDIEATRERLGEEVDRANDGRVLQIAHHLGIAPAYVEPPCYCHTRSCACCCHPQCGRCCACSNDKRPDFGKKQVRCLCQVVRGQQYRLMHIKYGDHGVVTATSGPYIRSGSWWFDVVTSSGYHDRHSLVDHSVVPIVRGRWNESNWLEFVQHETPDDKGRATPGTLWLYKKYAEALARLNDCCRRCGCECLPCGCCGDRCCLCYVRHDRCYGECCNGPNQAARTNYGPCHVRCLCQVVRGQRYRLHFQGLGTKLVTATSGPYERDGSLWFDAWYNDCGFKRECKYSLADLGVVRSRCGANSGWGGWAQGDWMEHIDPAHSGYQLDY
jgi:hypothetical protein